MSSGPQPQGHSSASRLGATFVPGGNDDYYIPVVSPLPQRSMPEVPEQIQENLAQFELDATHKSPSPPPNTMDGRQVSQDYSYPRQDGSRHASLSQPQNYPASGPDHAMQHAQTWASPGNTPRPIDDDEPSFSPFPRIQNRPTNVPPPAEEKEDILERARLQVLHSNDPEMQMAWAQDTLTYVDLALENEQRLAGTQPGRAHTPRVEHQLRMDAVSIVSFLADQHHPKAEFLRGMWLEFGKFGFTMDKKEAFRCYSRASKNGYARAEYRIGMQFESSNEIDKAITHYNLGIQSGDAAAYYRMGMMALLGQHGQRQDIQQGLDMIRYSAENADENAPQGAYVYGMLFARELPQVSIPDHFLQHDIEAAHHFIERAAYLGFAKAQVKIGEAYELCQLTCDFNPTYALHYDQLAARQGEPEAEMAISKWFLSGYDGLFPKNESIAFTYAQRAAQAGLATAEFAMGYFYEVGINTPVNIQEARVWYRKAADHGNKDALGRIDGISRSKTLSRKDHERVALARIATARGSKSGNRPERFTNPTVTNMPQMPAGSFDSSNSSDAYPPQNQNLYQSQSQVPYPSQNTAQGLRESHSQNSYSVPPPVSTSPRIGTPYGAPNYPNPAAYQPNSNDRPQSAVSALSASSNVPYGQTRVSSGPSRPYGNMQSSGPVQSPGLAPAQSGQYPNGYRSGSGSLPQNSAPPRQNYLGTNKPLPNAAADIGFSAPPDLTGADRRKYSPRTDASSSSPYPSKDTYPDRRPVPIQAQSYNGSTASPVHHLPSSPRPPRNESLPIRPNPGLGSGQAPGPGNFSHSATVPNPPPAKIGGGRPQAPPTAAPTGRRPGKGPATFEEMGVPPAKKEDDCIIM